VSAGQADPRPPGAQRSARVWDLPLRLFHWTLATLVVFSIVSIKLGGFWKDWHMRSGYAILTLLVFRILWGFAGSRTARFSSFLHGPRVVSAYLRGLPQVPSAGHNPLGGWSVLAMLAVLLAQAASGLFANDGSFSEGPLAHLVSGAASDRLSTLHRYGEWAICALVGLHLAAIGYRTRIRHEPLVRAMLTGVRSGIAAAVRDDALLRLRALVLALLAAALVSIVVQL
jgi:cytochrome b